MPPRKSSRTNGAGRATKKRAFGVRSPSLQHAPAANATSPPGQRRTQTPQNVIDVRRYMIEANCNQHGASTPASN
jgi:hypothetical protein